MQVPNESSQRSMTISDLLIFMTAFGLGLAIQKPAHDDIARTPGFYVHHEKDMASVVLFYMTLDVTSILVPCSVGLIGCNQR